MPHNVTVPTRARTAIALLAGLAVAAAPALFASGCGSSSATLDPVAQAAEITAHVGGVHMAMTMQVSAGALASPISINGQGFFNYTSREGKLSMDLVGLPAATELPSGPLHIEEIFKSSAIYVGSTLFAGKLPGGARWMKIDLARFGQALGLNLEQLTGGQSNPAQFLEYLRASGGGVRVVGRERVRGVAATRYRGKIDLNKVADLVPSRDRSALRAAISKLTSTLGVSSVPVEVWVDAHRLVRRIAIAMQLPIGGKQLQLQLTVELFDFGPTPRVSAPSPGDTYEVSAGALGGLSSIGG